MSLYQKIWMKIRDYANKKVKEHYIKRNYHDRMCPHCKHG